jgi:hypothetical protein
VSALSPTAFTCACSTLGSTVGRIATLDAPYANVFGAPAPPTILRFGKIDQRGTAWTRPENHVGNGPYRLATWVPNDRIEVVRDTLHYSDPAVGPRRVVFFPTDNTASDESAYRAGQRHVTYDLLPDRIATYRAQSPSPLRIDPQLETAYLRFNTTRPPLNDARVRRAHRARRVHEPRVRARAPRQQHARDDRVLHRLPRGRVVPVPRVVERRARRRKGARENCLGRAVQLLGRRRRGARAGQHARGEAPGQGGRHADRSRPPAPLI